MFRGYRTPRGDRGIRRACRSAKALKKAYRQIAKLEDKSEKLAVRNVLRSTHRHTQYYSWYWHEVEQNLDQVTFRNDSI